MKSDSELLAEIAEDYTVRLRSGGDQPSIESYVEKHPPHLADGIRKMLSSVRAIEHLGHREHSERKFERKTRRLTLAPDGLLGDFKIIREVGRGGMGVVYEAEQQSLKRRVALKILGPTMAGSPKQLARFQSEAKAVARLHHTNIVSVYGVGEHEGLYYYAMQLIDGMTLSEAIAIAEPKGEFVSQHGPLGSDSFVPLTERPTDIRDPAPGETANVAAMETLGATPAGEFSRPPHVNDINKSLHSGARWQEIARLGACVADALHYAHSNGVWHRDIKPSNLILDRQGVIWITDFGLARHEDMDAITATGDIVGTLRYMAPEQFEGGFDGRCDTYSLGMTIYEMLTLRPAFTEPNQARLIKLKTHSLPPAPRSLSPDIPKDLETIVLKACAVNPAHRYFSPAELAADLRRFLEDRPIHARRVTARERLFRWARRNPLAAALSLISILSVTSAFIVFAVFSAELQAQIKEQKDQTRQAEHQQDVAESIARKFGEAVDHKDSEIEQIMAGGRNRMLPEPICWEIDSEHHVSTRALPVSDLDNIKVRLASNLEFAKKFDEKAEAEEGAARAMAKAGDGYQLLGQYDDAARSYWNALKRFTNLLKLKRTDVGFLTQQVRMHARIDEVRRRVSDQSLVPADAGSEKGLQILLDDPGKILSSPKERDRPAKYELIRTFHSRHFVTLQERDRLHMIGEQYPPADYDSEIAENQVAIGFMQELLESSDSRDYKLLSIRIQTDRGRLELLRGKQAAALVHFNIAARDVGELLLSPGTREARSSLHMELAYLLCVSPAKLTDIHKHDVTESLDLFANQLSAIGNKERFGRRATEIAEVARLKLAEYRSEFAGR